MRTHCVTFLAVFLFLSALAAAQVPPTQPAPPAQPGSTPAPQAASGQSSSSKPHQGIPAFLILGTVFNEKAYALPGVEVKIRRKGEKKFRYDLYTNSRGEFAVRVPDGIEYEVVVRLKGYKDQIQEVLANMADVQKRLTFKLEAIAPPNTGESK